MSYNNTVNQLRGSVRGSGSLNARPDSLEYLMLDCGSGNGIYMCHMAVVQMSSDKGQTGLGAGWAPASVVRGRGRAGGRGDPSDRTVITAFGF